MRATIGWYSNWGRLFSSMFMLTPLHRILVGGLFLSTFGAFSVYLIQFGVICLGPGILALGGGLMLVSGVTAFSRGRDRKDQDALVESHGREYAREISFRGYSGAEAIAYLKKKGLTDLGARQAVLKMARAKSED